MHSSLRLIALVLSVSATSAAISAETLSRLNPKITAPMGNLVLQPSIKQALDFIEKNEAKTVANTKAINAIPAPAKFEYPINRYAMEVKRQLDVLDRHLAQHRFLSGDDYTVADMAVWPWYGTLVKGQLYDAGEFLSVHEYMHVLRWTDEIALRPAVQRGRMVNRTWGEPSSQLHERHDASDFDLQTQDKLASSFKGEP